MNGDRARGELLEWFVTFADCVRRRDYTSAELLFADRVIAFGTRNEVLDGIAELRERQWQPTWNATRDFRFLSDTVHVEIGAGGAHGWGTALWTSLGEPGDRPPFERRGRASFVFARDGGRWRCTHSHLSMSPSGAL
jgi:ketosteroid isomerase-like protein